MDSSATNVVHEPTSSSATDVSEKRLSNEGTGVKNFTDKSKSPEKPADSELHGGIVTLGDCTSTLTSNKSCHNDGKDSVVPLDGSNPSSSPPESCIDAGKETPFESSVVKQTGNNEGNSQLEGTSAESIRDNVMEEIEMSTFQSNSQTPVNTVQSSKDSVDNGKTDVSRDSGTSESSCVGGRVKQLTQIFSTEIESQSIATAEKSRNNVSVTDEIEKGKTSSSSSPSLLQSEKVNEPTEEPPVLQKATSSPVLPVIKITVVDDGDVETVITDSLESIKIVEKCIEKISGTPVDTTAQSSSNDKSVQCVKETSDNPVAATEPVSSKELAECNKEPLVNPVVETTKPLSGDKPIEYIKETPDNPVEVTTDGRSSDEPVECIKETPDNPVGEITDRPSGDEAVECIKETSGNPVGVITDRPSGDEPVECIKETSDNPIVTTHSLSNDKSVEYNEVKTSQVTDTMKSPTENIGSDDTSQNEKGSTDESSSELLPEGRNQSSPETNSSREYDRLEELRSLGTKSCQASIVVCSVMVVLIGLSLYKLAHEGKMPEVYETVGLSFSAIAGVVGVFSILYISLVMCLPDVPIFSYKGTPMLIPPFQRKESYSQKSPLPKHKIETFEARLEACRNRFKEQNSQSPDPELEESLAMCSEIWKDYVEMTGHLQCSKDRLSELLARLERKIHPNELTSNKPKNNASAVVYPESENSVSEGTVLPSKKDD